MEGVPRRAAWALVALSFIVATPLAVPPLSATSPPSWGSFQPDGGEMFAGGSYYDVRWQVTHGGDPTLFVAINLIGGGFVTAGEFPTGGAAWAWHVPTVDIPSARVRVCAVAYDGSRGCRESAANFSVVMAPPYVGLLSPSDGAENVSLDAPMVLGFDPPPNLTTTSISISPSVPLTATWSTGDTRLTLTHAARFAECTSYALSVATDFGSFTWGFTTLCPSPRVLDFGFVPSVNGSIWVSFSKPMDRLETYATTFPSVPLVATWSQENTYVTLRPSPSFSPCTTYTAEVLGGKDMLGNPGLVVPGPIPNPWTFTTPCPPAAPRGLRISSVPPDGVRVSWTLVTGADLYRVYESSDRFAQWPWTVLGETTNTFFETGHFRDGLVHFYLVRAVAGGAEGPNSTMAVKAELGLTFSYNTTNVLWLSLPYNSTVGRATDISNEITASGIDAVARWDPVAQSTVLWYYFRNRWRGADFTIGPGDGLCIGSVATVPWPIVGTDRTVTLSFRPNPSPSGNVNWISLPWTTDYMSARDIVVDIEGSTGPGANTRIVEVGRWDYSSQDIVTYRWTPAGWAGSDFTVTPGDGTYLRIVAPFDWQPRLLQPPVP